MSSLSCSSASFSSSSSFIAGPLYPKLELDSQAAQPISSYPFSSSSLSSSSRSLSVGVPSDLPSHAASSASKTASIAQAELTPRHEIIEKLLKNIALSRSEQEQKLSQSSVEPFMLILQNESLSASPKEQLTAALSVVPKGTIYENLIKLALVDYYYSIKQPAEAMRLLGGISGKEPELTASPAQESSYERLQLKLRQERTDFFLAGKAPSRSLEQPEWQQWKKCIDEIKAEIEILRKENLEKFIWINHQVGQILYKAYNQFQMILERPKLLEYLQSAAELDDMTAQYEYAMTFPEESDDAIKWFECSARNGSLIALEKLLKLGKAFAAKDSPKAESIFRTAAELGNAESQFRLAHIYGKVNALKAAPWFKKAAENQYSEAVSFWSAHERVFSWIVRAQEHNDLEAQLKLASEVFNPTSSLYSAWPKSQSVSDCYYIRAANNLHVETIKMLYEDEGSSHVNWSTAASLYEKAAAKGSALAMWRLGAMLWNGSSPTKMPKFQFDQLKAIEWIRKAAAAGNEEAIANLKKNAVMYLRIEILEKEGDPEIIYKTGLEIYNPIGKFSLAYSKWDEASKYYTKAAQKGHREAQKLLAKFNHEVAPYVSFAWLKSLVKSGDPESMYLLAMLYLEGRGTTKDVIEGSKWLIRAKYAGWEPAIKAYSENAALYALIEQGLKGNPSVGSQIARWLDPSIPGEKNPHLEKNAKQAGAWYEKVRKSEVQSAQVQNNSQKPVVASKAVEEEAVQF